MEATLETLKEKETTTGTENLCFSKAALISP